MPSVSPAQARLMAMVAHGGTPRSGGGPSMGVAREFNQADAGSPMLSQATARQRAQAAALRKPMQPPGGGGY